MANPSIAGNFDSRLEDIDNMISRVADRRTPLLNMFLDLKDKITNVKFEWSDKTLRGFNDSLATALTSTTTTTITTAGSSVQPKAYLAGVTYLRLGNEVVLVTSVISVTVTHYALNITRAQYSTTAATYAAGYQFRVMSNPRAEGFDANRDDTQLSSRNYNYSQIFERQLKISDTAVKSKMVDMEAEIDKQAAELTPELLKDLEGALLNNAVRNGDTTTLDNRISGGLPYWANALGTQTDMAGAAFSFAMINDVITAYLNKGGDPDKILMIMPVTQQHKLNELKENRIIGAQRQSDMTVNPYIETYNWGTHAQVKAHFSTDMQPHELYFLQSDTVKVRPFIGRSWDKVELAKVGDSHRAMIVGEYGFQVRNARETLYRLYNLAT